MKIEYGPEQKNEEKSKYPYFGEVVDEDGRMVVMFTGPSKGMVVMANSESDYNLYEFGEDWSEEIFIKLENFSVKFSTD